MDEHGSGTSRETGTRTIERVEETMSVSKRTVATGLVSVSLSASVEYAEATADLERRDVEIRRVPVGRVVDAVPETRVEDGVTIVSVVEEVLVVERRLMLVEEVHIGVRTSVVPFSQTVPLRKQVATVERTAIQPSETNRSTDMSSIQNTTGLAGRNLVTAFFDSRADASAAADRIADLGISRDSIRVVEGAGTDGTTALSDGKGFWESLGDLFMPDDDRRTYAEGLRRGGYLLTVPTTAETHDRIVDILDDEGTVDMDEREQGWRSEGWTGDEVGFTGASSTGSTLNAIDRTEATGTSHVGTSISRTTATASDDLSSSDVGHTAAIGGHSTIGAASTGATATDGTTGFVSGQDAGRIDVVEESLKVGKRDVAKGRVRVRSYVVEDAVSQDVDLRSEHVEIERRAVDRPVTGSIDAFADRTIELHETAEEAVVSKEARVVEEIDLNTVATERTETVSDTVRRTEVEIEDERKAALDRGTGTTGRDV